MSKVLTPSVIIGEEAIRANASGAYFLAVYLQHERLKSDIYAEKFKKAIERSHKKI
jgi:hypothetical protein